MKPEIALIKGTDDAFEFQKKGQLGQYLGNTNIDERLDRERLSVRGLFLSPLAFKHTGTLLAQSSGLLFNCITDPDISPLCLAHLNKALKEKPRAIINHPQQVMRTRRDEVANTLQGLEGLIVPRVIRVEGKRVSELVAAISQQRLRFPLLVRGIGSHMQRNLLKIDSAEQLGHARNLGDKGWYVTEFTDYRSADGLYRNHRFFVFASGEIVARNIDIGTDWMVGVHVREQFMQHRDDLLQEAMEYVENHERIIGRTRLDLLQAMRERLGLDYLGLDCNLLPSGEMLLFEANVAMNAAAMSWADGKFAHFDITNRQVSEGFSSLIRKIMSE